MTTDPNTSPLIPTDPNQGGAAYDATGSGATSGYGDAVDGDDDDALGDDFAEDDMDAEDDLAAAHEDETSADLDPSDDDVLEGAPLDDDIEDDLDDDL